MNEELNPESKTDYPERCIRANYTDETIRVYQAYSNAIADAALEKGTFVSPPFKMDRMTWIKPSFCWMMYRAGWGEKDDGQKRILAIDIRRDGFEWALAHSSLSSWKAYSGLSEEMWKTRKAESPVRIQWDPERDMHLNRLDYRSIQIGLSGVAVHKYVREWIVRIEEVTTLARRIHVLLEECQKVDARELLPLEEVYPLEESLKRRIALSEP